MTEPDACLESLDGLCVGDALGAHVVDLPPRRYGRRELPLVLAIREVGADQGNTEPRAQVSRHGTVLPGGQFEHSAATPSPGPTPRAASFQLVRCSGRDEMATGGGREPDRDQCLHGRNAGGLCPGRTLSVALCSIPDRPRADGPSVSPATRPTGGTDR